MLLITNKMASKMSYILVQLVFHAVIIFAIGANSEFGVIGPMPPNWFFQKVPLIPQKNVVPPAKDPPIFIPQPPQMKLISKKMVVLGKNPPIPTPQTPLIKPPKPPFRARPPPNM